MLERVFDAVRKLAEETRQIQIYDTQLQVPLHPGARLRSGTRQATVSK